MENMHEILDRLDRLDKQNETIKKYLHILTEVVSSCNSNISSTLELWKLDKKKSLGLSNNQVGLPRIDDNAIIEMSKLGITNEAQAKILNCSIQTIYNHKASLKKAGLI